MNERHREPVIAPLQGPHLRAALGLVASQWPEVPPAAHEALALDDPWRDLGRVFGALVGEEVVAHARFHYRPVAMGRATLHMVGLSCVVTRADHRRRGIGHRVLRAALDWMAASGAHFCAMNTGVPNFYSPLGWGRLRWPLLTLRPASLPRLGSGRYPLTRLPIDQAPAALAGIYDAASCGHPITLRRTEAYWAAWPRWARRNPWVGLVDDQWTIAWKDNRPVGYGALQHSIVSSNTLSIGEVWAMPGEEEALRDIFDDLAARASAHKSERIEVNLPGDHPLLADLASQGKWVTHEGMMIRVVDLRGLLATLAPQIEARAADLRSPVAVRLESPTGSATVRAGDGPPAITDDEAPHRADLSPGALGALLLGLSSAADLTSAGDIDASDATRELLDRLFPCLHAHYSQVDGF